MSKEVITQEEDIFGEDLKRILGKHYHDEPVIVEEEEPMAEYEQAEGGASFWNRVKAPVMLGMADSLMLFMCWADKIDLPYGLVFLTCISMAFGHSLRKPGAYEV